MKEEVKSSLLDIATALLVVTLIIYLAVKTIVYPTYSWMDRFIASGIYMYAVISFIEIIANSDVSSSDCLYLPEAKSDLLFEINVMWKEFSHAEI